MKEDVSISNFTDDELKDELELRGFTVFDDYELDERINSLANEIICEDNKEDEEGFFLKKDFLGYELRDHLLDIAGLGGYVSEDEIIKKLRELLK